MPRHARCHRLGELRRVDDHDDDTAHGESQEAQHNRSEIFKICQKSEVRMQLIFNQ